jgi:hypothetical protein
MLHKDLSSVRFIEAVPEFDLTLVVFDAVSRREWLRRWEMRLQQHRIQAEHGIIA